MEQLSQKGRKHTLFTVKDQICCLVRDMHQDDDTTQVSKPTPGAAALSEQGNLMLLNLALEPLQKQAGVIKASRLSLNVKAAIQLSQGKKLNPSIPFLNSYHSFH